MGEQEGVDWGQVEPTCHLSDSQVFREADALELQGCNTEQEGMMCTWPGSGPRGSELRLWNQ